MLYTALFHVETINLMTLCSVAHYTMVHHFQNLSLVTHLIVLAALLASKRCKQLMHI